MMNCRGFIKLGLSLVTVLGLAACQAPDPVVNCGAGDHTLTDIQGPAAASPFAGQSVAVRGVVTASFQSAGELGGFYLSNLASADGARPSGVFVATTAAEHQVKAGDEVLVQGVVAEINQQTQLTSVSQLQYCGTAAIPAPVRLELPVADTEQFEALEGVLVTVPQNLVVNGHYQLARHGQFQVAPIRMYTPTQVAAPGSDAVELAARYRLMRLTVDDNRSPNPAEVIYPAPALAANNTLRSGDTIEPVTGILSEFDGDYRLQPTTAVRVKTTNPRPPAPAAAAADSVRVAAFNVLNYFNGEGVDKTFPTERGAKTAAAFERQHHKILAALTALNADIIGLMEIENDGFDEHSAIHQLVTALREASGAPWQFINAAASGDDGRFGGDAITNGLIYRADRITPVGDMFTVRQGPFLNRSRLPMIQGFKRVTGTETLVVAVNHFKSKGSCPRDDGNLNARQGDGQACWNAVRVESAQLLTDFIAGHPELGAHPARILLGDFNAYAMEDPIQTMLARGYHNLVESFEPGGYSYVYDGQAGSLDHLLVSDALKDRVLLQQNWSINADEPTALQYQYGDEHPDWYAPNPYRSSDHDPVYADIRF
ncbi:ExeM/NucH family extracellular endonuclease [Pseudidiomarina sp.]|uniref:ExeM/NucH family extracellular endonuclease n=1 Tax=Pseudidiomarina sp. TaxID=2081707 RepID=UPI00299EFA7F|nr:ExeM/NucH family extracellular endonuclease [Pseudidiomarina sp.]MDX1706412.1 ExeM/NucH family extracellular endonuclease [Pseudidiomarina sp.]